MRCKNKRSCHSPQSRLKVCIHRYFILCEICYRTTLFTKACCHPSINMQTLLQNKHSPSHSGGAAVSFVISIKCKLIYWNFFIIFIFFGWAFDSSELSVNWLFCSIPLCTSTVSTDIVLNKRKGVQNTILCNACSTDRMRWSTHERKTCISSNFLSIRLLISSLLLIQLVPLGNLTPRWVADLVPVVQSSSSTPLTSKL